MAITRSTVGKQIAPTLGRAAPPRVTSAPKAPPRAAPVARPVAVQARPRVVVPTRRLAPPILPARKKNY